MRTRDEQTIEKIIGLMRADRAVDAPAAAVRRSKNLFRARAAEPKKSVAQRILAVLRADLSGAQPAFGERSASARQERQMFFQAGEYAVDIRVAQTERGFDLRGQILGENFAGCAVNLGAFETAANEIGEFKLTNIPVGIYNLTARKDEKEIVVENLELK